MKKYFFTVLVIIIALALSNCGDGGGGSHVISTPTPSVNKTDEFLYRNGDMVDTLEGLGVAVLDYRGELGVSAALLPSAVEVPPLPSAPPPVPSGNVFQVREKTTQFGQLIIEVAIYFYKTGNLFSLDTSSNWKETETYQENILSSSYGAVSYPTPGNSLSEESRAFTVSRWVDDDTALRVYTTGSGNYDTPSFNSVIIEGTQVLLFPRAVSGETQIAYNFEVTRNSDGSLNGSVEFNNGTGTFTRTALNESAIGTATQYSKTQGTINITSPVARTFTFEHTVNGDGSMVLVKTFNDNVISTKNYNSDGSGNGTITGIPQTTITFVWDSTGTGTATVKVGALPEQTFTIYVPWPDVPFLPAPDEV